MFDLNLKPANSDVHLVLAHGAGAGLRHAFMQTMQELLSEEGINTWTFNFGYMQKAYAQDKKIPPSRLPQLIEEYSQVIATIQARAPKAQLWVGGKSMGGRVACHVASESAEVQGVAVLGYPFHPVGKPHKTRLEILAQIVQPVLILQGERDAFGHALEVDNYPLAPNISVSYLQDGDHSFKPRKASGLTQDAHLQSAAAQIAEFLHQRSH